MMKKYKRFKNLYKSYSHLEGKERYFKILEIIREHYLDEAEQGYYHALEMSFQGRKQQDLCLIMNTFQSYISVRMKKLVLKMKLVANLLSDPELENKFNIAKNELHPSKFAVFQLLLLGNNQKTIAKKVKLTPPAINYKYKQLINFFNTSKYSLFHEYLTEFKHFLI